MERSSTRERLAMLIPNLLVPGAHAAKTIFNLVATYNDIPSQSVGRNLE
jgi:hypothetical protein